MTTFGTDPEIYGYPPYPAGFEHIARELETMAGCDVNVIIEHGYDNMRKTLRTCGTLGLAGSADLGDEKRLRYTVGEDTTFEISAGHFTEGQLVPGMIWVATGDCVLSVERRHYPPKLAEAQGEAA